MRKPKVTIMALSASALLVLTACSSVEPTPTREPSAQDSPSTQPTKAAPDPSQSPVVTEDCKAPATEIEVGTPASGSIDAENDEFLFCVQIPQGVTSATFELTGLTGDLDLFVAYPSIDDLQGGLGLRFSDNEGTADESVVIEPPLVRGKLGQFERLEFVSPGSYYIEVSRPTGGISSGFTLMVQTT